MALLTKDQAKKFPPGSAVPGKSFVCDSCGKLIGSLRFILPSGKDGCSAECRDRLERNDKSKKKETTSMKKDKKEDTKKKKKDAEELEEPEEDETETNSDDAPDEDEEEGAEAEEEEEEAEEEAEEDEEEAPKKTSKKKKEEKSKKKKSKKTDDDDDEETPKKKTKKGKKKGVHSLREGSYVRKLFERLVEAKGQWVSKKVLYKGLVRPFAKVYALKQMAAKYGWDYQEKKGIMDLTGGIKLVVPKADVEKALGGDDE